MQTIVQDKAFGSKRRLFPTYVAALLWCGLILRDARLVEFLPFRRRS